MEQQHLSAAVVGFTPLERAGLTLLLRECGVVVACMADHLGEIDDDVTDLEVVVVDLSSYETTHEASLSALGTQIDAFRSDHTAVRIIGVSERTVGIQVALDSVGIDAFVDADARPELLMAVLAGAVQPRRPWVPPLISLLPLTSREREILALIASGHTSRSVASALGISVHTVESHKQRVFRRLGVQNQAQAVAVSLRLGLLNGADCVNGAAS